MGYYQNSKQSNYWEGWSSTAIAVEVFQIAFIVLSIIILVKDRK